MFEFLLDPGKLQEHLNSDNCDPSPTQLISLFLKNIPVLDFTTIPPDSYEAKHRTKKAYALETLALKVASFLNWDLDLICNNLTIPVQHKLMEALHNACLSSKCPKEVKQFADIVYHHWFLRSAINYQLSTLQPQSNNTTIIYLSQLQQQEQAANISALSSMGELFAPNSKHLNASSQGLHDYIKDLTTNNEKDCTNSVKRRKTATHPFKNAKLSRPTMDCFDSRFDEQYNDWDKSEPLNSKEFLEEACYDLGRFFFFEEKYDMARQIFDIIKDSSSVRFSKLNEYRSSSIELIKSKCEENGSGKTESNSNGINYTNHTTINDCDINSQVNEKRKQTEKYLFDCMTQFSKSQKKEPKMEIEEGEIEDDDEFEEDSDLRIGENNQQNIHKLPPNSAWYLQVPTLPQQQQLLEAAKGDMFMSQGNFKQAMGCFVGTLMLMTDYFRIFTKNYVDEEPYISRMIQCSISLSCFTQAVALCQMTRSINYTMAFKQLNERICNDCCADIYECIWNITLLEYIINLHAERGEVEMRTKVIQLIGQLELNENNPEDILKEAEHVRRGRFFRIMANKYL